MVLSTLLQNRVVLFPISEPRCPLPFPSEPRGSPPFALRTSWFSHLLQSRMAYSFLPQNLVVLPLLWLPRLGLNPSAHLPLQPHFRLLLQSAIPASIPVLPALLGCHSKSGQVWPHGVEPIISKLSPRPCNQGELLPSPILGGSHSHLPGSKHGHSYLTHLWNQLKVIDMLNDCQGLAAKLLLPKTALNGPVPCVPSPLAQACRGEDILHTFF